MKVKDIAEFKENRNIAYLISEFEQELKRKDDPFDFGFDDVTAQIETQIIDVGLVGIEIVRQYINVFAGEGTRVDLYRKQDDEWVKCFSKKIDAYPTIQQGVWETIAAYREKLERQAKNEKKRKYRRGDQIQSLDEMMDQEFVYWDTKIYPRGWFGSWQLRTASDAIKKGRIYKAIRKENDNA